MCNLKPRRSALPWVPHIEKNPPGETMSTNFNQNDESRMEKTSLPLRKRTPENFFGIFAVAMALSLAVFSIFCLIGGICQFTSLFLLHGDDLFMDFFNSIRDVSQGTGVYTERHVIYPPMANLIFLICMRFVPEEYASTSFEDRESWANYPSAVLVCFLFLFVFTILLLLALQKNLPGHGGKKAVLVFFLIVNPPVLYLLERANLLLLSILSLAVYALYYNAGQKWKRELALLALAFSFSIKLYPAVFGWFLIVDKRYKEAIRCILYGIAMFLIPSFFFGGPVSIFWTFENIFSYSTGTNGWNRLASFLNISESAVKLIFLPLLFLLVAAFVASSFLQKNRRKTWIFGSAILLAVPSLHSLYAWVFLLIPLGPFLFSESPKNVINWLYFAGCTIPFLFLPQFFEYPNPRMTTNGYAMIPAVILLLATCLTDTLLLVRSYLREKKERETAK